MKTLQKTILALATGSLLTVGAQAAVNYGNGYTGQPYVGAKIGQFDFAAPDDARWPALRLARAVMATGGMMGAGFNAAKETALDGFIGGQINFTQMAEVVEDTMIALDGQSGHIAATMTLDNVHKVDHLAREAAKAAIKQRAGQ